MDDETIPIINWSRHFDDSTTDTSILTDDSSVESDAPPIIPTTMPLKPRHKFWKQTIQQKNLEKSPHAETMFNTLKIKITVNMAITYSGTTGDFVLPSTPVTNISHATIPLVINLPYG